MGFGQFGFNLRGFGKNSSGFRPFAADDDARHISQSGTRHGNERGCAFGFALPTFGFLNHVNKDSRYFGVSQG